MPFATTKKPLLVAAFIAFFYAHPLAYAKLAAHKPPSTQSVKPPPVAKLSPLTDVTLDKIMRAIDWQTELANIIRRTALTQAEQMVRTTTDNEDTLSAQETMAVAQLTDELVKILDKDALQGLARESIKEAMTEEGGQTYLTLLKTPNGQIFLHQYAISMLLMAKKSESFSEDLLKFDPNLAERFGEILLPLLHNATDAGDDLVPDQ